MGATVGNWSLVCDRGWRRGPAQTDRTGEFPHRGFRRPEGPPALFGLFTPTNLGGLGRGTYADYAKVA